MQQPFSYEIAFARNLGYVTPVEQERLRRLRVALPGLGGVGGAHVQALSRLGIANFHLADLDTFDVSNFNRQLGAELRTLGRHKADVCAEMVRNVNPEADVRLFKEGIGAANMVEFLNGVDIVVDGLEYFCMKVRRLLYGACRERNIPVVCAGPIGYGAAVLVFTREGLSFDEYYGISDGMTQAEQLAAFGLGLSPGLVSDVDPARVDIEAQKGPALVSSCLMCAAAAATEILKLSTGRGKAFVVPHGLYLDPYRGRTVPLRPRADLTRSWRGRILRWLAFRRFPALSLLHQRELAERDRLAVSQSAAQ